MYVLQILVISYQFQHISSKRSNILKTVHHSEEHPHLNEEPSCRMGKKSLATIHLIES